MENLNFSRQRILIKNILKSRTDHPTADMVYQTAREADPQISLGTVYRNLKLLSGIGEADTLDTADKKIHYDGNVNKHSHFICERCGEIYDVWEKPDVPSALTGEGFTVKDCKCVYYGTCKKCKDAETREK